MLVLLLGCLLARGASAPAPPPAATEAGYPFVSNYTPRMYGGDAQNWAVLQDTRGLVYAGNNRGVLEYDGVRWRLIPTDRRTVVRSLALDATGRVYVGAVGEIGYLAPDAQGTTRFVSLNDQLPLSARTFSDVWTTCATPRGILFQTREFLFLYREGRFQVEPARTTFHVAFAVGGRLFVRQRDVGLEEWTPPGLALVPGGQRFARTSVFAMLTLGTSGGILVGTRDAGLWRLDAGGLAPFASEATAFLKNHALYSGTRLADGTLALATIQGGVVLLDPEGRTLGLLDRRTGLQSDNVKAIATDRDSGLWLALDNGISRAEWPSPLTALDERAGLKGTVWAIQRFQERLYVATGQGAYVLEPPKDGADPRPRFRPLDEVGTQSLSFLPLEDRLLLASAQGLFEIRGGKVRLVRPSSNVAISILQDAKVASLLYLGMQGGLVALWHPPGSEVWKDLGRITGTSDDVYSMIEDGQGRLWLGTGAQGALRLTFPAAFQPGSAVPVPRVESFGTAEGLVSAMQPVLFPWRGGIMAATSTGVMAFDEAAGRFGPEPSFAALFPAGPRQVKAVRLDGPDRVWLDTLDEARGIHETGAVTVRADGSLAWDPAPYRRFAEASIEAIQVDPSGVAWFGGPAGVLRYDPARERGARSAVAVLIRNVSIGDSGVASRAAGTEGPVDLPVLRRALRFEFASPSFDLESANLYQTRLEGYDRAWSPWSPEAQKEYTNLPEGAYRFLVRAKDIYGSVSPPAAFAFRVHPPWYRSRWALGLYAGLFIAACAASIRLWTRILHRRNASLQLRIERATLELRERERLLAAQAGTLEKLNTQLIELNEQKSRFLAIVAHDLRNPLTGILLSSQLIGEEEDIQEIRRRAGMIVREGAEMEGLIERFLELSALDGGKVRTDPGHVSVPSVLETLITRHESPASAKGIRLGLEADPDAGRVFADEKLVAAVLDNLLSNAIKFSPRGSAVDIRVEDAGDRVRISIQDQGPGLTEDDRARIFQRYARLSARPTGGEKSVGLGLSIAKQMVEASGGRIWVESEAGKGATFRVELPRSEV